MSDPTADFVRKMEARQKALARALLNMTTLSDADFLRLLKTDLTYPTVLDNAVNDRIELIAEALENQNGNR